MSEIQEAVQDIVWQGLTIPANMLYESEEEVAEDKQILQIMDTSFGDIPIAWKKDDPAEIAIAKAAYDKAKERGMLIYKIKKDGSKGRLMDEWDSDAEKIVASPRVIGG